MTATSASVVGSRLLLTLVRLSFLTACGAASSSEADDGRRQDADVVEAGGEAKIERTASIPIREVSGLGLRWAEGGALELLAVGDRDASYAHGAVDVDFIRLDDQKLSSNDRRNNNENEGSQWEAVTSDASGSLFVLQENPGKLLIFDGKTRDLVQEIEVNVDGRKDWKDPNSRGEGMVLLKNGHILLLKEKDMPALVEVGPNGDRPKGYRAGDAVGPRDRFPLPPATEERGHTRPTKFGVLKQWKVGDGSSKHAEDMSDLAAGPDGRLYVLSDQSRTISIVDEGGVSPDEDKFRFDESFKLPHRIEKPEGLVVLDSDHILVATDIPEEKDNLFALRLARKK